MVTPYFILEVCPVTLMIACIDIVGRIEGPNTERQVSKQAEILSELPRLTLDASCAILQRLKGLKSIGYN